MDYLKYILYMKMNLIYKYYKNKLELTIINILYKNINIDFTKKELIN
jgi:hypothetical protein